MPELAEIIYEKAISIRGTVHLLKVSNCHRLNETYKDRHENLRAKREDARHNFINARTNKEDAEIVLEAQKIMLHRFVTEYRNAVHSVDTNHPDEFKQAVNAKVVEMEEAVQKQDILFQLASKHYEMAKEMYLATKSVYKSTKLY